MKNSPETYLNRPFLVDEMAVYFHSPETARVIETDCRVELTTTAESCTCCTFRFNSVIKPGFRCRHIRAVRRILRLAD
ncbi:MAG: hypothetical protein K6T29_00575 [Peptococcaceae bacterium]|nr:hypothetical protein [Peptococcaceae bacterium]